MSLCLSDFLSLYLFVFQNKFNKDFFSISIRISSYGRKKRDLSSLSAESNSQLGDLLVTQAFMVTDKFGKKATSPSAKAVIPKSKVSTSNADVTKADVTKADVTKADITKVDTESVQPPPSRPWFPSAEDLSKESRFDFNFDQVIDLNK
jgi:uncharacterized protein YjbI with pentapeptide repeats